MTDWTLSTELFEMTVDAGDLSATIWTPTPLLVSEVLSSVAY
jgi:hypothetical protein